MSSDQESVVANIENIQKLYKLLKAARVDYAGNVCVPAELLVKWKQAYDDLVAFLVKFKKVARKEQDVGATTFVLGQINGFNELYDQVLAAVEEMDAWVELNAEQPS